jgi:hypothetical protein
VEAAQSTNLVTADELRDRLPLLPSAFAERMAYVGDSLPAASLGRAYLGAFASCTGADLSTMRFGWVDGGTTLGTIPLAVEIDGYSGWDLATIWVQGNASSPNLRRELSLGEHDGWQYLYVEGLALTAGATTLHIAQQFCCVDWFGDPADIPSFEEIVDGYLDVTPDSPAPMPAYLRP